MRGSGKVHSGSVCEQTMLGGALYVVGACVCVGAQTMLGGALYIDVSICVTSL